MSEVKAISPEEFRVRLDALCAIGMAGKIISAAGGFKKLPAHLKADALRRMGIREVKDEISDAISYVDTLNEVTV